MIYQGKSRKRRSFAGASASWPLGGLTARAEFKASRKKKEGRAVGEDSLLERVTAAAEERQLSENTLTASQTGT